MYQMFPFGRGAQGCSELFHEQENWQEDWASVQLVSPQQQELGWSSGLTNSSQARRKLPECVQVCLYLNTLAGT